MDQQNGLVDVHSYGLRSLEDLVAGNPGIDRVAAVLSGEPDDERLLVYLTFADGVGVPTPAEVHSALAGKLPDFVGPSDLVLMETIPLAPDGSIYYDLLPNPEVVAFERGGSIRAELLYELIAAVFGRAAVDLEDTFFDLGGNSLLMSRLVTVVRSVLGIETRVHDVLAAETIASFVAAVTCGDPGSSGIGGFEPRTSGLSVSAVRLSGALNRVALRAALSGVADRHGLAVLLAAVGEGGLSERSATETALSVAAQAALAESRKLSEVSLGSVPATMRPVLFRLGPDDHVLLVSADRAAVDERSVEILLTEVGITYTAQVRGCLPAWPMRSPYQGVAGSTQRDPANLLESQQQPTSSTPMGSRSGTAAEPTVDWDAEVPNIGPSGVVAVTVEAEQMSALKVFARRAQISTAIVVQTAIVATLAGLDVGTEVWLDMLTSGRIDPATTGGIGPFTRRVVARVDVSGNPRIDELAVRVREAALAAEEAPASAPPPSVCAGCKLDRVVLSHRTDAVPSPSFAGLTVDWHLVDTGGPWPPVLTLAPDVDGLAGELRFDRDQLPPEEAAQLVAVLNHILTAITTHPRNRLSDLLLDTNFPFDRGTSTSRGGAGAGGPTTGETAHR